MTEFVGVHDAKTLLSQLLEEVAAGADIVITSRGEPVVRLSPVGRGGARQFGIDRGRFVVPDDFDGPPDEEVLQG
jgi:prevent-host-death family protein